MKPKPTNIDGRVSVRFRDTEMIIELHDADSNMRFAEVKLSPEQAMQVMSGVRMTECTMRVCGLELVGKRMEQDTMVVEVPDRICLGDERKKAAEEAVLAVLPDGWELFDSFSSKGSFFRRGGRRFVRANIRRWVNINEQEHKG